MKLKLLLICIFLSVFSCNNDDDANLILICETEDLGITEADNTVTFLNGSGEERTYPWQVRYFDSYVELSHYAYQREHGSVYSIHIFKKVNDCVIYDYSYDYSSDYWDGIVLNHTQSDIQFNLQEWIEDEKLVGQLIIDDTTIQDFWVTESSELSHFDVPEFTQFNACLESQLPLTIDLDSDGTPDFAFDYSIDDFNQATSNPRSIKYRLTFGPLDTNNKMLNYSSTNNSSIYYNNSTNSITTEGKIESDASTFIALYKDFDAPYKRYNHWLTWVWIGLFNPEDVNYDSNYYFLVKKYINNEAHYGWINFSIDFYNCNITVHETYLNDVPNEHVVIN